MSELYHHGVKGMRWGVRRYQNPDGTLTKLGAYRLRKSLGATAVQLLGTRDTDADTYVKGIKEQNVKVEDFFDDNKAFSGDMKKAIRKSAEWVHRVHEDAEKKAQAEIDSMKKDPRFSSYSEASWRALKLELQAERYDGCLQGSDYLRTLRYDPKSIPRDSINAISTVSDLRKQYVRNVVNYATKELNLNKHRNSQRVVDSVRYAAAGAFDDRFDKECEAYLNGRR